jgi:hypothetical protein
MALTSPSLTQTHLSKLRSDFRTRAHGSLPFKPSGRETVLERGHQGDTSLGTLCCPQLVRAGPRAAHTHEQHRQLIM